MYWSAASSTAVNTFSVPDVSTGIDRLCFDFVQVIDRFFSVELDVFAETDDDVSSESRWSSF